MFKVKKTLVVSLFLSMLAITPALSESNPQEEEVKVKEAKYSVGDFVQTTHYKNGVGETNWTANVISAEGWGSPPNNPNMSASQKKNQAYTAALVLARRNLLTTLEGVHINSKTTVKDAVVEEDLIKEELDGFLKGSQIIKGPIFEEDGTVKVTVGVKIFGKKGSVSGIIVPYTNKDNVNPAPSITPVPTPTPVPTAIPTVTPTATPNPEVKLDGYSGLVVDCTGLKGQSAMSPAIFNSSGEQIYVGNLNISPDLVISQGVAKYYKTVDAAKTAESVVGKNPLVIKAVSVKGNFKSDIVVSNEDAQKIIGADKTGKFLEKLNVAMVL